MKIESYQTLLQETQEKTSLTNMMEQWAKTCNNCHPLTPITCVAGCKIWKLKNEYRTLYRKMKKADFMTNLLNTLKNERRVQILAIISKGQHTLPGLQKELKKIGYYQSQQTITKEYLAPLIEVGLAEENQNRYNSTVFGSQLSRLVKDFSDAADVLPPHSECYEETVLGMLLDKPRTFDCFETIVPAKSVPRVLSRLQRAKLIEATKENDYIFYFRTKRDSNTVSFSITEKKVYDNVPPDGISARKLAEKSNISIRRTYKYLRRLKGKKLVFTRKKPKSYALTAKGLQAAEMLKRIRNLALETLALSLRITNNNDEQWELSVLGDSPKN